MVCVVCHDGWVLLVEYVEGSTTQARNAIVHLKRGKSPGIDMIMTDEYGVTGETGVKAMFWIQIKSNKITIYCNENQLQFWNHEKQTFIQYLVQKRSGEAMLVNSQEDLAVRRLETIRHRANSQERQVGIWKLQRNQPALTCRETDGFNHSPKNQTMYGGDPDWSINWISIEEEYCRPALFLETDSRKVMNLTRTCTFDLQRAFDSIWREGLWWGAWGGDIEIISLLETLYQNRRSAVRTGVSIWRAA